MGRTASHSQESGLEGERAGVLEGERAGGQGKGELVKYVGLEGCVFIQGGAPNIWRVVDK